MIAPQVLEPSAKLNLGLELLGRRPDGYHEVATVYQEIDLCDRLVLEEAGEITLEVAGLPCPVGEDNLVLRAARSLARAARTERGARLRLEKRIPARAGLGGASSDAAAALQGLDRLWGTHLGFDALRQLASDLGSDVPFFLVGGTALGLGRGDEICPLPDLPSLDVLVLCPDAGLSTSDVYARAGLSLTEAHNCNIIRRFAHYYLTGNGIRELVRNELETAAAQLLPEVRRWRGALEEVGAQAAALSGSGSAVFGLFSNRGAAESARERLGHGVTVHSCRFRSRALEGSLGPLERVGRQRP